MIDVRIMGHYVSSEIFVSCWSVDLGKLAIVDHLLDGIMYSVWLLFLLNFLEVQTGMAVKVSDYYQSQNIV